MARHALSRSRRRALLRAGLTVTAVGAALGAGGAAAQAAPLPVAPAPGADSSLDAVGEATGSAVTGALGHGVSPVTNLQLDPLAKTGVDPLNNRAGARIADFEPVSTGVVTDPLSNGGALNDQPLVGQVTGLMHG
ncbi:hypothetical protein ACNPQM_15575 [Streptomyces sp. NPDC056231]|uniref:hypothetical protein n=1 Tax=Streptomyces sp. NPDC056231 TaxID=3345755 RepID=UPI003AACDE76